MYPVVFTSCRALAGAVASMLHSIGNVSAATSSEAGALGDIFLYLVPLCMNLNASGILQLFLANAFVLICRGDGVNGGFATVASSPIHANDVMLRFLGLRNAL